MKYHSQVIDRCGGISAETFCLKYPETVLPKAVIVRNYITLPTYVTMPETKRKTNKDLQSYPAQKVFAALVKERLSP